ncbi:hypothetical protein [Saccharopolyspora elongata]|uniref:Mce-associated membrane protein n=1 Tax=Saccharopolyspora elongata TaxID=2530387 RepID=A0A4V2YKM3_9PSEU|nr:hypothetical protein [Saccharopolyspora elongata]TDD42797.1 hypothetical protein E1288_28310 [Saccharopolyspora elongata]
MPSNRRKTPTRRPKVAGLRNRETLLGDALQEEAREARRAAEERQAAKGTAKREPDAETPRNGSVEAAPERSDVAPAAGSVQPTVEVGEADVAERGSAERGSAEPVAEGSEAAGVEPEGSSGVAAAPYDAQQAWTGAQPGVAAGAAASGKTSLTGLAWTVWILAVLFIGAAVFLGIKAFDARYSGAGANQALVSAGATSEVNGQIGDAVEKVFSYDFNDTGKTEAAARDLLVGSAVQKYDDLFKVVREQAPQQQLIVTTTVKNSAVTRLQGDRAELLLFVDQHAMRANTGESNVGPAQISVSAEKQGEKWKITQITLR